MGNYDPCVMPFESIHSSGQHYQSYRKTVLDMVKESNLDAWRLANIEFLATTVSEKFDALVKKYKDKMRFYYDRSYLTFRVMFDECENVKVFLAPMNILDKETRELVEGAVDNNLLKGACHDLYKYGETFVLTKNTDVYLKILEIYFERSSFIPVEIEDDFLYDFVCGEVSMKWKNICKCVDAIRDIKLPTGRKEVVEKAYANAISAKYKPSDEVYYFCRTNKHGDCVLMRDTTRSPRKHDTTS